MAPTTSRDPAPGRHGGERPDLAQDILDAAYRLVAEKGEAFTTQELTKEAGVALQTFYRYYGGKDQLLLALIADMVRGHCEALEGRGRLLEDPIDRLHLYVTTTLGSLRTSAGPSGPRFVASQHWRLLQLDPQAMDAATKPFADLVQRELEAARAAGTLAPRDPERDAWLIAKLVISVFHHFAFASDGPGLDEAGEEVWEFCHAALSRSVPSTVEPTMSAASGS